MDLSVSDSTSGAIGDNSFSEGYLTTASGDMSHAEGYGTTAGGRASELFSLGYSCFGDGSELLGEDFYAITITFSDASDIQEWMDSPNMISFITSRGKDIGTVMGTGGLTIGVAVNNPLCQVNDSVINFNLLLGSGAHAEGSYTTALGGQSHAEGNHSVAFGNMSPCRG